MFTPTWTIRRAGRLAMAVEASNRHDALLRRGVASLLCNAITLVSALLCQAAGAAPAQLDGAVARAGDVFISAEQYQQALDMAVRRKFYHGKVPESAIASLQREVIANLVDTALLAKEARRRGLKPDADSIKRILSEYETRYQSSAQWQSRRAVLLPQLRRQLETESLLQRLQSKVRNVAAPEASQLRTFYNANPDKFTEPERLRVSVILLKVDPSSPRAVWDKARGEAVSLVKQLRAGASFSQRAKERSGDESAARGGDMGYVHRGMLAEPAQLAIDKLKPGEITEPITVLQGVAMFRLDERIAATLSPLPRVEQRAIELWQREQGEKAWQGLLAALRKATPSVIDEEHFLPINAVAEVAKVRVPSN